MADTGKSLFRKVEKAIEAIERSPDAASTIAQTAAAVIEHFREDLGVRGGRLYADRFAAIAVGDEQYILSFSVDPSTPEDDLMASLGILRHAVDQKLRQERFVSELNEARQIQMSILPKRPPKGGPYDLAGFTAPAEIVGGDFFDFIPVSEQIQGVAIADASGHGLPAALQVRDVYTGLRMGVARDFKI